MNCPNCNKELFYNSINYNLPNIGLVNIETYSCECSFKNTKINNLEKKDPIKIEFIVDSKEKLYAKIVRGPNTDIFIKELGMSIISTNNTQNSIASIESILLSFKNKIKLFDNKKGLDEKIDKYLNLKEKFTIIIDSKDGFGKVVYV